MRILQVHNFYQQPGGEDRVLAAEAALLSSRGHAVSSYTAHNDDVNNFSALSLAAKTMWNATSFQNIRSAIRDHQAEIVHVHNTFPLVSPAVYYAAEIERVPVVQTLHNYRFVCPSALLYRSGNICEECISKTFKYPAVVHGCYRSSRPASAAIATTLFVHQRALRSKIRTYIALTEFARAKFVEGGLPAGRIVVKPNFLADDPQAGPGGDYALFAGRLSEEKGIIELLSALQHGSALPLKIAGDGPLREAVQERASFMPNVEYLGPMPHDRLIELLQHAALLMFPSRWYEGMPMVVVEAMACATPVAAFAIGSVSHLIEDGVNGFKIPLLSTAEFLSEPAALLAKCAALRASTRAYFERNFTSEKNYQMLSAIYREAIKPLVR